ncbi:unnamed protein product, partial [Leptidea sinapis]
MPHLPEISQQPGAQQHTCTQECGVEVWDTILREAGGRNTVFMTRQQYPDALMLRVASALARFINNDGSSPAPTAPSSPAPRKLSLKSKPAWRSASVHTDNRNQAFKCPFSSTNALTAATKKEIDAFNSSEEIRSGNVSTKRINELEELNLTPTRLNVRDRRSLGVRLETFKSDEELDDEPCEAKEIVTVEKSEPEQKSPITTGTRKSSIKRTNRKVSCTLAVDVYKRRGSGAPLRPRLNSLGNVERLNELKEKFGTPEKVMHFFGRCFVKFFSNYGYDTMIRATGRYFCTFLQSVDNIHQRMRFTFPNMRSPSMQLTRAHRHGAELVTIVKESMEGSYYVAVLRLEFDNSDYLVEVWGGPSTRIEKSSINEIMKLRKPKVAFTWDKVVCMQTIMFELELMRYRAHHFDDSRRGSQGARAVLLKGPIHLLEEIDALIFLCSPIFNDLDELRQAGLYLADMNGHGLSKELVLRGWQHLSRLELLFEKAENRSMSLEKSCRLLDEWKKKGDQLLYSMIPRSIAYHLRAGKSPMSANQEFDCVTIMFCGIQITETDTRTGVMAT